MFTTNILFKSTVALFIQLTTLRNLDWLILRFLSKETYISLLITQFDRLLIVYR